MWSNPCCSSVIYELLWTHPWSSDPSAAKQVNFNSTEPFKALSKHFLLLSKLRGNRFVPRTACINSKVGFVGFGGFSTKWMLYFLFVNISILMFSAKNNYKWFMLSPKPIFWTGVVSVYPEAVNNSSTITHPTSALTRSVGLEYGHDDTHTTCGMTAEMWTNPHLNLSFLSQMAIWLFLKLEPATHSFSWW